MFDRITVVLLTVAAIFLRNFPNALGRWRIVGWALPRIRRLGSRMGKRSIWLRRYRLKFECDLSDWLGQYVYLTGVYEGETERVLRACAQPGSTVLDIGANVGYFAVVLARSVGPTGCTHAFEPVPSLRKTIKNQLLLNPGISLVLHDWAASDTEGTATIFEGPRGHKGLSSLRPIEHVSEEHTIKTATIDSVAPSLGEVSLAKIDVEGAEMKVLRGMSGLIERHQPCLVVEFTDEYLRCFGDDVYSMIHWFHQRQYTLYQVTNEVPEGLVPLVLDSLPPQCNVLAIPARMRAEEVMRRVGEFR